MKPTLRLGTPEDIPRLLELAQKSATAAHWSLADYEHLFAPKIVQKSCLLVAETAGTVNGFLVARGLEGDWEIENIVVSPDFRRQGLGTELMRGFLGHAVGSHVPGTAVKTVHLEVRESNLAAQELYKTLGFANIGRRKSYYSGPPEDAILLKLSF
jgi:[ribosomal protein S18]-alanine N-acetyltransferase